MLGPRYLLEIDVPRPGYYSSQLLTPLVHKLRDINWRSYDIASVHVQCDLPH